MSNAEDGIVRDWRGTPIVPGALVVYGAPVGRSIAMVEGTVDGFTKSGRVNVRIIRRSYGGWSQGKDVVHVGADRLTIVETLPPTDVLTDKEKYEQRRAEAAERERIENTHDFPPVEHYRYNDPTYVAYGDKVCRQCHHTRNAVMHDAPGAPVECPRVAD